MWNGDQQNSEEVKALRDENARLKGEIHFKNEAIATYKNVVALQQEVNAKLHEQVKDLQETVAKARVRLKEIQARLMERDPLDEEFQSLVDYYNQQHGTSEHGTPEHWTPEHGNKE